MSNETPYVCDSQNATQIFDWLRNRGGILIWGSVNLSNPGASWTSPANDADGKPVTKPNWQCGEVPVRNIVDIKDVQVFTAKEVKRFHVALQMAGLSAKCTDGSTRKIRSEVDKAAEKYGRVAFYRFDYSTQEAVIMIDDEIVSMEDWAKSKDRVEIVEDEITQATGF